MYKALYRSSYFLMAGCFLAVVVCLLEMAHIYSPGLDSWSFSLTLAFRTHLVFHFGEGNGTPLPYSCLENPTEGGAWWAAVHGVTKSWTRLSDFTFTFHFHALEKEMATHSSVLAWRIPGMGSLVGCRL